MRGTGFEPKSLLSLRSLVIGLESVDPSLRHLRSSEDAWDRIRTGTRNARSLRSLRVPCRVQTGRTFSSLAKLLAVKSAWDRIRTGGLLRDSALNAAPLAWLGYPRALRSSDFPVDELKHFRLRVDLTLSYTLLAPISLPVPILQTYLLNTLIMRVNYYRNRLERVLMAVDRSRSLTGGNQRNAPTRPDWLGPGIRCALEMVLAGGLVLLVGLPAENIIFFGAVVTLAIVVMVVVLFWALSLHVERMVDWKIASQQR